MIDAVKGDVLPGTLALYGQVVTGKETFAACFREVRSFDDLVPLLYLDDNFTAVYERGSEVWIVNSLYSLTSYYYAETKDGFLHGDSLFALARRSATGSSDAIFDWDYQAVGDFLGHQHLIGEETLARGARVVPFGTMLHWDGARLTRRTFPRERFADPPSGSETHDELVRLFLDGLRDYRAPRPLLTASSGLDSRVNLAGMLHLGLRPELAVMGQPTATDVVVVKEIGKAFDLKVNHVQFDARAYVDSAVEIARATSGVKPISDWHTYHLASRCGYSPEDRVVTGINGEHVRAIGFDYGLLAMGMDLLSRHDHHVLTGPALRKVYAVRTRRSLTDDELRQCHPELASYYLSPRQIDRVLSVFPDTTFSWQCDAWVLGERRRAFQAAGLKLYSMSFGTYSPYMRRRWIDAGWRLELPWRLGSAWHRSTVERLCPRLLDFPEEKESSGMRRRPRPFYWVPAVKRLVSRPAVPYVDQGELLRRPEIVALLADNASELEGLMPRNVVMSIVDEQLRAGTRGRAFAMLGAMAVWRRSMRSAHPGERPSALSDAANR